jgi:hypothetical protein
VLQVQLEQRDQWDRLVILVQLVFKEKLDSQVLLDSQALLALLAQLEQRDQWAQRAQQVHKEKLAQLD